MKRLMIFVPGYQEVLQPGSQLRLIKNTFVQAGKSAIATSAGSLSGYRLYDGDVSIDMFEANWQSATTMLNAQGWLAKLTRGAALLASWLSPDTLKRAHGHASWLRWFALMLALISLWWVAALLALLVSVGVPIHDMSIHLGKFYAHASFATIFALVTAICISLGVSITASVDVADLFRRYIDNLKDENGIQSRVAIRSVLVETMKSLPLSAYDDFVIVAHSFGVLIALDAIASSLISDVSLVTLGGFLTFLSAENPWVSTSVQACLKSNTLKMWIDCYSSEDVFAAPSIVKDTASTASKNVVLNATPLQRFVGKAHGMYFSNRFVQLAIADPPAAFRLLKPLPSPASSV